MRMKTQRSSLGMQRRQHACLGTQITLVFQQLAMSPRPPLNSLSLHQLRLKCQIGIQFMRQWKERRGNDRRAVCGHCSFPANRRSARGIAGSCDGDRSGCVSLHNHRSGRPSSHSQAPALTIHDRLCRLVLIHAQRRAFSYSFHIPPGISLQCRFHAILLFPRSPERWC